MSGTVDETAGAQAVVTGKDDRWVVDTDHPLTFGRTSRSGIVGLDTTDAGISRVAGRIRVSTGTAAVENLSAKRPLLVEYPRVVRHQRVEPSTTHVLVDDATVLIAGKRFTHAFTVELGPQLRQDQIAKNPNLVPSDVPTDTEGLYTDAERLVLVALATGYLQRWPRHDPSPLTYDEAGTLLGIAESTARKRVEHVRERLASRGVLVTSGSDAKRTLIEWAIDSGVISVTDLSILADAKH